MGRISHTRRMSLTAAALALGCSGLVAVAPAADGAPAATVRVEGLPQYTGGTRYDTAAEAATTAYPDGADVVVIATGEKFADALAANAIAGAEDAPILLVRSDAVPAATDQALSDLGATSVIIVGGEAAVSDGVENTLATRLAVSRVAGDDRFATAAAVATRVGTAPTLDAGQGAGALPTVVLASGAKFPDAIASSPIVHRLGMPLLLTTSGELDPAAIAALEGVGAEQVIVVGGSGVVSSVVESALVGSGLHVERLAGPFRWDTARAVADFALEQLGFSASDTFLATGMRFPDALSGGPLASSRNGTVLLTMESSLPEATEAHLVEHAADIDTVWALGGTAAIDDSTLQAAALAADEGRLTVTPAAAQTLTAVPNPEASASASDDRTYTATGLDDAGTYRIQLFPAANVTVAADGTVSLADDDADGVADAGVVKAVIHRVNGQSIDSPDTARAASPVDGEITFTIDGDVPETVRPVVFSTTDGNEQVDLDDQGHPTDVVGVGGATTYDGASTPPAVVAAPGDALANADSDTQATVMWTDPTTGSPGSFVVYRNADSCANTAVADLTEVGTVAGTAANRFVDTGLAAATMYCYSVQAVQDGGASTLDTTDDPGDSVAEVTSLSAGHTAPRSTDVRLVTDAGTAGTADAGDVWRILFSEAIDVTDGDTLRVQDDDGELNDVVLDNTDGLAGDEADWSLNQSPVDVDGTTMPTRTVLTVTVETALSVEGDADGDATNNTGSLEYPLTITGQSGITDDQGDAWSPVDDPDHVADDEGAQTVNQIAPYITGGDITFEGSGTNVWSEVGDVLAITFSEPVNYVAADAEPGTVGIQVSEVNLEAILGATVGYAAGSYVTVGGSGTSTLTFTVGGATLTESRGEGSQIDGTPNANVQDLDGTNQVANPIADPTIPID